MSDISLPRPRKQALGEYFAMRPALAIGSVLGVQYTVFLAVLTIIARFA